MPQSNERSRHSHVTGRGIIISSDSASSDDSSPSGPSVMALSSSPIAHGSESMAAEVSIASSSPSLNHVRPSRDETEESDELDSDEEADGKEETELEPVGDERHSEAAASDSVHTGGNSRSQSPSPATSLSQISNSDADPIRSPPAGHRISSPYPEGFFHLNSPLGVSAETPSSARPVTPEIVYDAVPIKRDASRSISPDHRVGSPARDASDEPSLPVLLRNIRRAIDRPSSEAPSPPSHISDQPIPSIPSLIRILLTRTTTALQDLHRRDLRLDRARRKAVIKRNLLRRLARRVKDERRTSRKDRQRARRLLRKSQKSVQKKRDLEKKVRKVIKGREAAGRKMLRAEKREERAIKDLKGYKEAYDVERGVYLETIRLLKSGDGGPVAPRGVWRWSEERMSIGRNVASHVGKSSATRAGRDREA